ncbi:hypothetical protein LL3_02919 [Bacillus amyloliquefaciens LL3]|nr:hypothetical protein LL3_02919 [Bacillus amyloliquefaciens LL3]
MKNFSKATYPLLRFLLWRLFYLKKNLHLFVFSVFYDFSF